MSFGVGGRHYHRGSVDGHGLELSNSGMVDDEVTDRQVSGMVAAT